MDDRQKPADPASGLDDFARHRLARLDSLNLRRTLAVTARTGPAVVERGGQRLISFCCNDYLDLSHHPDVCAAAKAAVDRWGAGAGASRLVTGNHPLYGDLEERLCRIKGSEAACVFGSGYLANSGIIPALIGRRDLIVMDELCHACMHAGAKLSGARAVTFAHNDLADCRRVLAAERAAGERCLLLTETIFSMDGDRAPLAALSDLAAEFDCWLMTDDAHGLGVVKPDPAARVPLQMGTLSKAVGVYGGYLCASAAVVELVKNRARSFIYTTGLPPAAVAAGIAALDVIANSPGLTEKPLIKARLFTRLMGLPEAESSIVPLVLGDETRALAASQALEEAGFLVAAIRPPTVPRGTARLRFTFAASHDDGDIERLVATLQGLGIGL
jgi:8-amino-7-oxononanoate synthase